MIITEATLNAKLMESGIEGGTKAATEQQKVMARLGIIMSSTSDAQGDALRTSGSFANVLRGLTGSIKDVGVEIGRLFLPAATEITKRLRSVVDTIRENTEQFRQWGEAIGRIVRNVLNAISNMATTAGKMIRDGLGGAFQFATAGAFTSFQEFISKVLNATDLLTRNWDWAAMKIIANLAATQASIAVLSSLNTVKATVIGLFGGVRNVALAAFDGIEATLETFGLKFGGIFEAMRAAVDALFDHIAGKFKLLENLLPAQARLVAAAFGQVASLAGDKEQTDKVLGAFKSTFERIGKDQEESAEAARGILAGVADKFSAGFKEGFAGGLSQDDILTSTLDKLKGARTSLAGELSGLIDRIANDAANDVEKGKSPAAAKKGPGGAAALDFSFFRKAGGLLTGVVGGATDAAAAGGALIGKGASAAAKSTGSDRPSRSVEFVDIGGLNKRIQNMLSGPKNDERKKQIHTWGKFPKVFTKA